MHKSLNVDICKIFAARQSITAACHMSDYKACEFNCGKLSVYLL